MVLIFELILQLPKQVERDLSKFMFFQNFHLIIVFRKQVCFLYIYLAASFVIKLGESSSTHWLRLISVTLQISKNI